MKIIDENSKKSTVDANSINYRECFQWGGTIYMIVDTDDFEDDLSNYYGYLFAIEISKGRLATFKKNEQVVAIEAELRWRVSS